MAGVFPQEDGDGDSKRLGAMEIGRVSTSEALAQRLTQDVLDGVFAPGERLRETELAERFGVSRQSLRAALADLSHMGLLRREPYRGVRVPEITLADIKDLFYVREVIEAEAARVIAIRVQTDPGILGSLKQMLERFATLSPSAHFSELAELDANFHRRSVALANHPRLSRAHEQLRAETLLIMSYAVRTIPRVADPHYIHSEHVRIVDAMATGDPALAVTKAQEHLRRGVELLSELEPTV